MIFGKVSESVVGRRPEKVVKVAEFTPQGYAFPTEVSEGLVQNLLGTYGSRGASGPATKKTTVLTGDAARAVSEKAAQYAAVAEKIVAGVDAYSYAKDVFAMYPGGRAGLVGEISDVFYQYLTGNNAGGEARLTQVQDGFQKSADLLGRQKQADLQNQIDYYMANANRMQTELPYGEQWFIETAEANMAAKYGSGAQMLKSEWDGLFAAERARLREIAWETERSMNEYLAQATQLRGFADAIGPALTSLVTKLFGDVSQQVQILASQMAAKAAEAQAAEVAKYCSDQTAAMNNYLRLSKEFNDAVTAALADFTTTNADFWSKAGI